MHEELAEAYGLSGDMQYASFLSLVPDYHPTLLDRDCITSAGRASCRPVTRLAQLWCSHASVRRVADILDRQPLDRRSPTHDTQTYGHGHADAFAITLHGAGRLLYPDYNFIQYENPALGWTRNTIAHSTVVVDGQDSKSVEPSAVRHDFSTDVKFLATSASGVFPGVDQTRALMLTQEYLLDFFHAGSEVPHTYDYLLHSFGGPSPLTLGPLPNRRSGQPLFRRAGPKDGQDR